MVSSTKYEQTTNGEKKVLVFRKPDGRFVSLSDQDVQLDAYELKALSLSRGGGDVLFRNIGCYSTQRS